MHDNLIRCCNTIYCPSKIHYSTHTVWIIIYQTHSEHHDSYTVKCTQILPGIRGWLLPTKQDPETHHIGDQDDGIKNKVTQDVPNELGDNGHQGTQTPEPSGILEETHPDQNDNEAGNSIGNVHDNENIIDSGPLGITCTCMCGS